MKKSLLSFVIPSHLHKITLIALFLLTLGVGHLFGATYALTPNQTTTGSDATAYITTLTEFTHAGISWKMNQWNPSTLQVKTNQSSAESEFRFYNTSAFSGRITQVVIKFSSLTVSDASKLMFLGGTSEVTATTGGTAGTWNSTSQTLTWTPGASDNFTYFAFYQNGKAASGTNNLNSDSAIVVTYSAPPCTITLKDDNSTLTEASSGAGVTLPTRTGCTGYTFAGWTKSWTEEQNDWTTTAPIIIPASSYTPTANENLYPVYTKTEAGGEPVETKTQTFQYDTWEYGGSSTDKSSYRLFHNGGYVESASNVDFSKLSKVIVYGGTFGGGSYNGISIKKADGTLWKNATVSGSDQTGTNTITGGASLTGSAKLRVYSTSGTASGTGVRISKVEVYTMEGGSTTYYCSYPSCSTPTQCATPTFSPAEGTYSSAQSVTISCATTGATIHYTTDGSEPTSSSSTYSSAISVNETTTIKAIAVKSGLDNSNVATATYELKCATPTFSPAAGTYSSAQNVTINAGEGTTIHYTTDGSAPTTSSPTYSSPISVGETKTIKAIAIKSGWTDSDVASATYTISIPYTVTLNLGNGTCATTTLTETSGGAGVTLPIATPSAACQSEGWVFAGWAKASANGLTSAPVLYTGNYYPSGNETLYAVYTDSKFSKINSISELIEGKYIIACESENKACSNTIYKSYYMTAKDITISSGIVEEPSEDIIWNIIIENNKYIFRNAQNNKYLYNYVSGTHHNLSVEDSKPQGYNITFTGNIAYMHSADDTDGYIEYYSTYTEFTATTNTEYVNTTLFRQLGSWDSSPSCSSTATVTYDSNGSTNGSVPVDNTTYNKGNEVTVLGNTGNLIKTGYEFGGWNTANDGSGTTYNAGDKFTITRNTTLYAKWVEYVTVTLVENGTSKEVSVEKGSEYTLPEDNSTCEDAEFLGWVEGTYTDHETGTSSRPSTIYEKNTDRTISAATTFTAVYRTSEEGGGGFVKMNSSDQLQEGDRIAIVPIGDTHAIYQETVSSSYVNYWSFNSSDIDKDDKNWLTVTASANISEWYLGDDVNGYLYNSSGKNDLSVSTSYKSGWTIAWNNTGGGFTFKASRYLCCRSDLNGSNQYKYRGNGTAISENGLYYFDIYRAGGSVIYTSNPNCCTTPATPLNLTANTTELIGSGEVHLSISGGNGQNIQWSSTGGTLTDQTNTGATLTLPAAATTQTYTVTITQPADEGDEQTICGATKKVTITVKANYTITFKTIESGSESTYNTLTITDGENYQFPDLSEDYTCEENYSFAGWASSSSATAVEKTAGNTATATGNATWYAVWRHSTSVSYETRDKYELVTDASTLAANQVFVIGYANGGVALAQMTQDDEYGSPVAVDFATDKSYLTFVAGTDVMLLKLLWHNDSDDDLDGWYFQDNANSAYALTYSGKNGGTLYYDDDGGWFWDIVINATSKNATISDTETGYTQYNLQYNSSNSRFAFYTSNQKKIQLYRKNGTVQVEVPGSGATYTTNNQHCSNGATIRATDNQWITSSIGQAVKAYIPVIVKNFDAVTQLTVTSDNTHFSVYLTNSSVPESPSQLETILIIEYTPVAADIIESATITLTAGDVTRQITVHGRSLPEDFVIVTQKNGKWYALPANMKSGAGIYDGIEVTPNGSITQVPAAPSTAIYKLRSAANLSDKVRLVGNDNKCLWGNSTAGNTNIQNYAALANTNGAQYEWTLSTTDGETYQITLAAHPDTESGRQLAYGTAFGYYKTASIFYLLPVGCSSQPSNLEVSARRVDATFSWNSNASQTKIEIFLKSNGNKIKEVIVTASPKFIDGLSETTEYTYKLTPDGSESCAVTGEFKTTGPTIDLVEWQENAAIIQVDKDENVHPVLIVQGEKESGLGGTVATDLFFAKYFEGAGSMKLMSIFNGTRNAISLENYMIRELHAGNGASSYGTPKIYDLSSLGSINAGQEIILFTRPQNSAAESHLYDCSEDFLNEMAKKSAVTDNPRWIECDGTTFVSVIFNGNDALQLLKNGTPIDIIGASNAPVTSTSNCRGETAWTGRVKNMDYGKTASDFPNLTLGSNTLDDYSINTTDEEIDIYSARCIIFRNKTVTSGANAVANNTATFATFTPSEWSGRNVCKTKDECTALGWTYLGSDGKTYTDNSASTCNSYQDLGEFDYNSYYKDYNGIETKELDNYTHDTQTHTYTIPIENMKQYACLNLKFQLASNTAAAEILTEQVTQVPIVVTGNKATTDDIFSKVIPSETNPYPYYDDSKDRCKDCDVIVLGEATLTKAADNATHDVPQVGNIKVYPGGKLIIPAGTNYTATSLSIRRQEDEISTVNLQKSGSTTGNLTLQNSKGVYLDLRIDPTNWHYVTLPFDCNIDEVTYSNGTPAKLGTDWLCAWYDGDYRAAHQDGGWTDMQPGSTLEMGKGYIISLPGTGRVKQELRFPMAKSVLENEHTDKTIEGLYAYGAGMKGADGNDLRWNHRGWNMIGNPYMTYYNASSITTPLQQGTLEKEMEDGRWTGNWELNVASGKDLRYVVAPINNGWAGYQQQTIGDNLPPFTCYFVQIGGDNAETAQGVNFTAANTKHSIVRRPQAETEPDDSPVWLAVELTNQRNQTDETTLLISDRFTDDYDVMDDLVKMRGTYYQYSQITTAPVLASRNTEGEMAFNALPDATAKTGVALNYFAAERGQYTLSLSRKYSLDNIDEVWLYDSVEQIWHDLLLSDYSFSSARTDDKSRFTLTVRVRRQPKITTDISDISSLSDLRIVTGDRRLSVLSVPAGADLWIFDSSGKLIDERLSVSADRLLFDVPASGVYNVRVVTADSAVTLKAVVK